VGNVTSKAGEQTVIRSVRVNWSWPDPCHLSHITLLSASPSPNEARVGTSISRGGPNQIKTRDTDGIAYSEVTTWIKSAIEYQM